MLGLYGEKDSGIPLDTVDKMKSALASGSAAAKVSEFVVYPDAPHAFHADYRPSYRKEAAEDGYTACPGLVQDPREWFKPLPGPQPAAALMFRGGFFFGCTTSV